MAFILLIAFIAMPIIEIAVFIQVGEQIGLWPTLGVVLVTAVAGTALLRQQGISVLFRIEETMRANQIPLQEMFDGICLVVAGALLLTPGFVTDTIGFLLFVPPVRQCIAAWLGHKFLSRANVHVHSQGYGTTGHSSHPNRNSDIIDGEFEDITEREDKRPQTGPQIPPRHPPEKQ